MFKKYFVSALIVAAGLFGVVACTNDAHLPAPQSPFANPLQAITTADEWSSDEIIDDNESGARIAAIDTALQVKWQLRITGSCSATGTASFKYVETTGGHSTGVLSTSAASTAAGFRSFSVPPTKWNTALKKTLDKTKSYAVYAKVPGTPRVPASGTMAAVPATPTTYKFVTVLGANPPAAKALGKTGKPIGRPITTAVTDLGCPQ